jgi:hypothetical protein
MLDSVFLGRLNTGLTEFTRDTWDTQADVGAGELLD